MIRLKVRKVIRQIKEGKFGPQHFEVLDPQDRRAARAPMMIR